LGRTDQGGETSVPPFTSILVDIDASAGVHPALDRAIALDRHWGARLLVGRPAIALIQDVLRRPGRVLAAVNADVDDPVEQLLNVKLVELGLLMAEPDAGSLTILQAWAPFAETIVRGRTTADESTAYLDQAEEVARAGLKALTGSFGARLGRALSSPSSRTDFARRSSAPRKVMSSPMRSTARTDRALHAGDAPGSLSHVPASARDGPVPHLTNPDVAYMDNFNVRQLQALPLAREASVVPRTRSPGPIGGALAEG
jgi:hypothetical protein